MARPTKKGLDYFPFDTSMDKKTNLIMRRFGKDGYYITTRLLYDIYREEGYFCIWNDTEAELFAVVEDVEVDFLKEYIDFALCIGFFNKDVYETYGMLTSERIQEIYFEAVGRRKNVFADERILLIDIDKYCKMRSDEPKNNAEGVHTDTNQQNADTTDSMEVDAYNNLQNAEKTDFGGVNAGTNSHIAEKNDSTGIDASSNQNNAEQIDYERIYAYNNLQNAEKIDFEGVNVDINPHNAEKTLSNGVNANINPQIKENKNKLKENKEKESISNQTKSNQKKSDETKIKHSASNMSEDALNDCVDEDVKPDTMNDRLDDNSKKDTASNYLNDDSKNDKTIDCSDDFKADTTNDCLNDDLKKDTTKDPLSEKVKDNDFVTQRIIQSFEEKIGIITPDILCELLDLVKKYGESAVYNAIDEAVKNDVRSMLGVGWYAEKDASNYMVI